MDNEKEVSTAYAASQDVVEDAKHMDADTLKLASMGYTQDLERNFSVWSVLGVGFSLTNSWFAISAALITGINSGGPILIVYGIILIALISICVGVSLSELASAFPNAGGQYFWAHELAPKRYANFASYLTGWFAWAGAVFTSAAVALAVGSAGVGCYQLTHPDLVIQPWMVVVAYQLVNGFSYFFNCYGKVLPAIASTSLWVSLISFAVILITVPAAAPTHQSAQYVFANFVNNTGWQQNGIAFIVGLINTNWAFACLDCATHMAEEVPRPERNIPIAIMGTVAIGFVTSWFFSIALFFSLDNLDAIQASLTGVPVLELFHQALRNTAGAVVLESLIMVTGVGCLIACHTWQARLCWSFARDKGVPGYTYLARVNTTLDTPLHAHTASSVIVSLLGLLMVTASIVLLYISYSIPVICLLIRGRDNVTHGPFWMGRFGFASNIVLCLWTLFTLIMYSFPIYQPVTAATMNYVSVIYFIVIAILVGYWFIQARHTYGHRSGSDAAAAAAAAAAKVADVAQLDGASKESSSNDL
ncbi:MAG: hypothetical protein M1838_000489 [Thelocarpon superellum]|nr:MAG: hypothetical protein M1838_000489 [Thelocarpon superellum]